MRIDREGGGKTFPCDGERLEEDARGEGDGDKGDSGRGRRTVGERAASASGSQSAASRIDVPSTLLRSAAIEWVRAAAGAQLRQCVGARARCCARSAERGNHDGHLGDDWPRLRGGVTFARAIGESTAP